MKKQRKYLVIHCTDTPEGREVTADDIRLWHLSPIERGGRGWRQVGYSRLFMLNGTNVVLVGDNGDNWVDADEITNGAKGINSISEHICYAGGCDLQGNPADTRTREQRAAMAEYVKQYVHKHPNILIAAHYHFSTKACPSFNVENWLREIGIPEKNIYKK